MSSDHSINTFAEARRTPRYDVEAIVLSHQRVILNEYEIVLQAPQIASAARPGQFVMMLFGEGYSTDVRRPFSLFRVDRDSGTISVLYLARGSFTSELSKKQAGDYISVIGPLGRPFEWRHNQHARHLLVAGGLGAPPIYFLARDIAQSVRPSGPPSALVINGARSAEMLIGVSEFQALDVELEVLTEDGTGGEAGLATDRLQAELDRCANLALPLRIYACGPMAMLRRVASIGIAAGVSCQVSIETAMPCGVGECDGCTVRLNNSRSPYGTVAAKACWDGPVFEAERLVWDQGAE